MRGLLNVMAREAAMAGTSRAATRIGIVSAYDPDNYCAKVQLQPEGAETGWLPILSPWIGESWGLFCPPTIGDQVEVQFQEDSAEAGFICGRFFSDAQRPQRVESGEFWLVHKSGSLLKFHNDGDVELVTHRDLNATVGRDVTANVSGNVTATVSGHTAITSNGGVTIDGAGSGATKGVVQGDCVCAFTGMPHAMISADVKASI